MKKFLILFLLPSCAAFKSTAPAVVHLAAEDCVQLTEGDVKKVCATIDELMPFLDMILARRLQAAAKKASLGE